MIGALPWAGGKPVEILWVGRAGDAVVNVCCRPPGWEGGADALGSWREPHSHRL